MRIFRLLLSLLLSSGLIWLLSVQHQSGGKPLPVIGQFMNPFTGFWRNAEPSAGPALTDMQYSRAEGESQCCV
jgi:penicillin amidase